MILTFRFYGPLTEATGVKEEKRTLPAATTVLGIREALLAFYPSLQEEKFKIAVNQEFVSDDWEVVDDAEIALLPPIQITY